MMSDRGYKKGIIFGLLGFLAICIIETPIVLSNSSTLGSILALIPIAVALLYVGFLAFRGQLKFAVGLLVGAIILIAFFFLLTYVGTYISTGHFPGN